MTTTGQSVHAFLATGGREQQVMDYHGGSISDRGSANAPGYNGRTRARNEIRYDAWPDPLGYTMHLTSDLAYGNVMYYTGNLPVGAAVPEDKPTVKQLRVPLYFPN
jgi:hypothetical protein